MAYPERILTTTIDRVDVEQDAIEGITVLKLSYSWNGLSAHCWILHYEPLPCAGDQLRIRYLHATQVAECWINDHKVQTMHEYHEQQLRHHHS